jgi:hypothetical protein
MSDEFDGRGAAEKASIEGDLNRCRARAPQIASEPRNEQLKHLAGNCRWQTFAPPLRTLPIPRTESPTAVANPLIPW